MSRTVIRTACNRDCPDACAVLATVENGRVIQIQGDPEHPVTQGFLCNRTNRFLLRQYDPDRLTAPLLRVNGQLTPVAWDVALDHAAERLAAIKAESGPAAIFHYRSGGSLGLLKHLGDYFFELFGPVTTKRGDICSGAGDAAQMEDFGDEDSHDLFDLHHSKNIILWGKNPFVSNVHLIPVLKEAKARGAQLVLIDPVHHRTAAICDRYVAPRPGGDVALALGTGRVLFEKGWVDPDAQSYCDHLDEFRQLCRSRSVEEWAAEADVAVEVLYDLAERLARRPTAIVVGWGMQRRSNGAAIVRCLDALGAVSGNLGIRGGGVSFYFKRRGAFDLSFIGRRPPPRTVCEPLMAQELETLSDPPVRACWITAGNPVAMLPDSKAIAQALSKLDFLVVVDAFLTDTAQLAHLVLPTTTMLEEEDLVGAYGHHYLGSLRPVVAPPEGVLTDLEILEALASRLGVSAFAPPPGPESSARRWKRRLLAPLKDHGVDLEAIEAGAVKNPRATAVLFENRRFATASGRVNLITRPPEELPGESGYPLYLMSLSTEKAQSSQWAGPPRQPEEHATVVVHPETALGLGDLARLESPIASLVVKIRRDPAQRRDVVIVPKGGWLERGQCANALVRARTTDAGEGGALYDQRVRLVPVG